MTGFAPITHLSKFASDMRDWAIEAVMPRLADVKVHAINERGDTGFLLVAVARSERRPHQCEFGEKGYFRRAGASSRRMEHFEIEDAFRRISSPELSLEYCLEAGGSRVQGIVGGVQKAESSVTLRISLRNVSPISARSAYVTTSQQAFCPNRTIAMTNGITFREQAPHRIFDLEAAIHPDVDRLLAPLEIKLDLVKNIDVWVAD